MGRISAVALALLVSLAHVNSAAAQEPAEEVTDETDGQARALFESGRVAFDSGDFETALHRFEAAYALSPRPLLLYNIGTAADRLRQTDKAIVTFERYLAEAPNAANSAQAEARLEVLRSARARELELARELEEAEAFQRDHSAFQEEQVAADKRRKRRRRIAIISVALAIAGGAAVAIWAANRGPDYEQGDLPGGVTFTLGAP